MSFVTRNVKAVKGQVNMIVYLAMEIFGFRITYAVNEAIMEKINSVRNAQIPALSVKEVSPHNVQHVWIIRH